MADLDVGALLAIPCEIMNGAVPDERFIRCMLGTINIEGAIPKEFTDEINKKVIAVVYEKLSDNFWRIFFNGDIFQPGNPITLSNELIEKNCERIII